MNKNNFLLLLLSIAVFLPQSLLAQTFNIFADEQIMVAGVIDRNDRKLNEGTKQLIRQSIIDACTNAEGYEISEVNIDDIKTELTKLGKPHTPQNMCEMIGKKANVKYIVFPEVRLSTTDINAKDIKVYIDGTLFRIETASQMRSHTVGCFSNSQSLQLATADLIETLLGVKVNRQNLLAINTTTTQTQESSDTNSNKVQINQQVENQQQSQDFVEDAGVGLNMKMIYVDGGSFQMGATPKQNGEAESNESPVHTVQLESFYIAECEVTQAQWQKIMGTTIFQQRDKSDASWSVYGVGDNNPMYYVSWEEAQMFCRELSAMTGKTYLLPTEAQWEYAARGGKKSRGYKYSGSYAIDAVAWYSSNSGSATHWVKQKRANELGLYDMSGNVWEWCSDWFGNYSSATQSNPTGAVSGSYRVLRGGSWLSKAGNCRVSRRDGNAPSGRNYAAGFRVVCLP